MSPSRSIESCLAATMLAFGLFLSLQGCAQLPSTSEYSESSVKAQSAKAAPSLLVAWVSSQSPGSYADTVLDDPVFGKQVSVQIESNYISALGMPCRRARINVVVNGPPAEKVSVCQDGNGIWYLAPRILKNAVADSHQ